MSGFVCVWNLDGEPVDGALLRRMSDAMVYRGPDRGGVWQDGAVGMAHRLLITTFEAEREQQPCTLDGSATIAADARIDDRDRLKRELLAKGRRGVEDATDVELILHAYHAWGEQCIEHLLGDFSFVIWDAREQRLFCARDHWGIRLLYYARVGNTFIVSNELNVVRLHPAVSSRLNDLAIADFLLFDYNPDLHTTTFADIQRLPPAHTMTVTRADQRQRRYWVLPHDQQVRFKRDEDYIERFKELLHTAVSDRLRRQQVAIFLSGGLDSPTIAAAAKAELSAQSAGGLRAYTFVYDELIPDDERHYAGLAAEAIGIPIEFFTMDDAKLFFEPDTSIGPVPEPFHYPITAYSPAAYEQVAASERVVLYGEDGDALLYPASVAEILPTQGLVRTARDVAAYWRRYRRPTFGLGLMGRWRRLRGTAPQAAEDYVYPAWLEPDFERRLDLKARWKALRQAPPAPTGARRPQAYRRLTYSYWQQFLEELAPAASGQPVEYRLPLMDLRLAAYLLALPVLPWCMQKHLLRQAGKDSLPEGILTRCKTPLAADPAQNRLRRLNATERPPLAPVPALCEYVIPERVPELSAVQDDITRLYLAFRPLRLNHWLSGGQFVYTDG